ncbi:MAG: OBAP family protein [Pseudomonadota bacterium]
MTPCSSRLAVVAALTLLTACREATTPSPVTAPGADKSTTSRVLETGADVLQNKAPLETLNAYLNGFHFYSGKMNLQMEAHHYCTLLNEDVHQCIIYDGNTRDAKIMGIEYIVSARLFASLPEAEKALWHSHVHEVKSGQLVAPGVPQAAEHALMNKLVSTYGKTWHTWHTDLHKTLPLGVPQLMMGSTADGQLDPDLVAVRDRRLGVDTPEKRRNREDLPVSPIDPGANAWERGHAIQLTDPTGTAHHPVDTPPEKPQAQTPTAGGGSAPRQ